MSLFGQTQQQTAWPKVRIVRAETLLGMLHNISVTVRCKDARVVKGRFVAGGTEQIEIQEKGRSTATSVFVSDVDVIEYRRRRSSAFAASALGLLGAGILAGVAGSTSESAEAATPILLAAGLVVGIVGFFYRPKTTLKIDPDSLAKPTAGQRGRPVGPAWGPWARGVRWDETGGSVAADDVRPKGSRPKGSV